MTQTLEHTPDHEQPAQPDTAAPSPAKPTWIRQRRFQVLAGALAVLALSGTAVGIASHQHAVAAEQQRTADAAGAKAAAAERARLAVLTNAVGSCSLYNASGADLGDGGRSLIITTETTKASVRDLIDGTDSGGVDMEDLSCVLSRLDAPDAVIADMNATRALDGRQHATWDDLAASWSYHPDSGFNLVLTVA